VGGSRQLACYHSRVDPQPEALLDLLELDRLEPGVFRSAPPGAWLPRVFGGQLLAQAVWAASRELGGSVCHSFHASFLRGGEPGHAIDYHVSLAREGKLLSLCNVTGEQRDQTRFVLTASFEHQPEDGPEYQHAMPEASVPEAFGGEEARVADMLARAPAEYRSAILRRWPFEWITLDEYDPRSGTPGPDCVRTWMRAREALGPDPNLHRCALAYASDMIVVDPSMNAVGVEFSDPSVQIASLDHAMWFHRSCRADDWLLFVCDSPSVSAGRGFNRGTVYDRQGRLVATLAQEAVLRRRGSGA
jgi:acyl-CoA thioesterase-2